MNRVLINFDVTFKNLEEIFGNITLLSDVYG